MLGKGKKFYKGGTRSSQEIGGAHVISNKNFTPAIGPLQLGRGKKTFFHSISNTAS